MTRDELLALAALLDERCEAAAIEKALQSMRDPTPRLPITVATHLTYAQLNTIRTALRAWAEEAPRD
jgi:hypothetical protein